MPLLGEGHEDSSAKCMAVCKEGDRSQPELLLVLG